MTTPNALPSAAVARRALVLMRARVEEAEAELARLDAAIGDGDHGAGMVRGLRAACAAADALPAAQADAGQILAAAGAAFADAAGGASGALVGSALAAAGQALAGALSSSPACSSAALQSAVDAALATVAALGEAAPGDKTLLDTLHPFAQALGQAAAQGLEPAQAWQQALPAAAAGAAATAALIGRRGRASRLGERSRGHLDPGAVSTLYLLQAIGAALAGG